MESCIVQIDEHVETILQARDLAVERLLEENKQRFTSAGMEIILIYKTLFNWYLRWCWGHIENLVPKMLEFQSQSTEYEYSWSDERDEDTERLITEFPKLMESKAERIRY